MKRLYVDCGMGAAGDMLGAALLELMPDPNAAIEELNALGLPGVTYKRERVTKCGLAGTLLLVCIDGKPEEAYDHAEENHAHTHTGIHQIEHVVEKLPLSDTCKANMFGVYRILAEAESKVHGLPVSEIHFHEVGTMDAIADIAAVCMLMEKLAPDEVLASPVCVGSGQVLCAHGILPVPAPATAEILKGIPMYTSEIQSELCTPTGAALLRYFVDRFCPMPVLSVSSIGYGMGKKDFERANCLRAMLGENGDAQDRIVVLSCNLDDMSAEDIGYAMERLFSGGALEVYTVPIGMKKNRPGVLLRVICSPEGKAALVRLIFQHTTTIGIREETADRYILSRETERRKTCFGEFSVKKVSGYGVSREKYEYEDLARIAREQNLSIQEIRRALERNKT